MVSFLDAVGLPHDDGVLELEEGTAAPDAATVGAAATALLDEHGRSALVYLATWSGWVLTDGGWSRTWAEGSGLAPAWLRSLWHYHVEMYNFHVGLSSEHSYQSSAWGWFVQARPTSMYYESYEFGATVQGVTCEHAQCSSAVTAIGNPAVWWLGTAALVHQVFRALFARDWRSSAVVVAVLAGWLPWVFYADRTIFSFYSVVFVPFLAMALALSLGTVLGPRDASAGRRSLGIVLVTGALLAVVAAAWWFLPVWTGELIDYEQWRQRMWFDSWV